MRSLLISTALLMSISACSGSDGNPVSGGTTTGSSGAPPIDSGQQPSANELSAGALKGITLNSDGTITLDNIPFDGSVGTGREKYFAPLGVAAVTGFEEYESQDATPDDNQVKYFAVYRETGNLRVGSVGTGDYEDFGWGGAYAQRTSRPASLRTGAAVYNGNYGGVRITAGLNGTDDVNYVDGDVTIKIDFDHFNPSNGTYGAVEGYVSQRQYFDVTGTPIGVLPTVVLGTGEIDSDGFIQRKSVRHLEGPNPTGAPDLTGPNVPGTAEVGFWHGVIAGNASQEIGGIIILGEPDPDDHPTPGSVREVGVFTAAD